MANYNIGKLNFTTHENKSIVELTINNILVAKNKDDDLINFSSILQVAGASEDKMAELVNEDMSLVSDRTIVDSGKYRGVWIKTPNAIKIAEKLGIRDIISSLIDESDKKSLTRSFSEMTEEDDDTQSESGDVLNGANIDKSSPAPTKKSKTDEPLNTEIALAPLDILSIPNYDQVKEMSSQIFMIEGDAAVEACKQLQQTNNIEVPIDLHGNTLLHWATSLANVALIFQLVELGGNPKRGNTNGETPLMKAVTHLNFFDSLMFDKLLDALYPSIFVLDNKHRSVLHHVVLLAGTEGRSEAAKYYLQCLVEWIIKNGSKHSISLDMFMKNIVDLQDSNGDTALNIIARIGNKAIAQSLLDIGADIKIANKAGLTPEDFKLTGLEDKGHTNGEKKEKTSNGDSKSYIKDAIENNEKLTSDETTKKISSESQNILENMKSVMGNLDKFFQSELETKQSEVNKLYKQLKESTNKLTESRAHLEMLKNSESRLNELKQRNSNIDTCIQEEEAKFASQFADTSKEIDVATYDPDQPFKQVELFQLVKTKLDAGEEVTAEEIIEKKPEFLNSVPPAYILRARVQAYKENEKYLTDLSVALDEKSSALEKKFRHVVSLCTGVEESKVDDLLEGLVQAVESDPDEVDFGRVAGFLTKVDDD